MQYTIKRALSAGLVSAICFSCSSNTTVDKAETVIDLDNVPPDIDPPPSPEPEHRIYVTSYFEQVYEKPNRKGLIGQIRAGQSVKLQSNIPFVTGPGVDPCAKGWFAIEPRGFICASDRTTFQSDHPKFIQAQRLLPNTEPNTIPFSYGTHKKPSQRVAWAGEVNDKYRGPDGSLLPKKEVSPVEMPVLNGIVLNSAEQLPIAFVRGKKQIKYTDKFIASDLFWERHSFIDIIDEPAKGFVKTKDGFYLKLSGHVTIIRPESRPERVSAGRKWISVRINSGSLVAYEGDTPVFATAMSPGKHGTGPGKRATKQGLFTVNWKLTTTTMDGIEDDGKRWMVQEVPYTMFFHEGYAIHGAWWHNNFGLPMSHGCVNISPQDSQWIFLWSDPPLPSGWYGVVGNSNNSTFVKVSP